MLGTVSVSRLTVKQLVICAVSIALAAVASMIRLYRFPFGGSVTLCSMLFAMLPAWLFGPAAGSLCGLIYGLLQFITGPTFISVPQFLCDYFFAFSVMGIGGFFRNRKNGLVIGYIAAVIGRWVIATLAGLAWVAAGSEAWSGWSPLPYSMVYNGAYIFTEGVITVIILMLPPVKAALERVHRMA